ncbi:cytochrome P450 [Ornithinimicrobium pekingense]|uniref:Fatty-acid peroxygenase n=1 Tax=Ornithinimicrobium pekingense TaxID=384677 RepID=A0ABQ2F7X1_9MICO|nr:cytochrome P450 [Ornithinimicrobium pekingense]GGK60012.1 fatty-acid peroxygenase [Ornithinimicrobium pekingense]
MSTAAVLRDHTLDLVLKGYTFAREARDRSEDPRKGSRLMLRALGRGALLVRGEEGVRLFYDTDRMRREGAMPAFVGGGLFGKGSVHGLDDEAHRHRKSMFVRTLMDPQRVAELLEASAREWSEAVEERWLSGGSASVYDVSVEVYGRSLLRWAGVEADRETLTRLAHDEADIVDGFAVLGPAWLRTQVKRRQCDAWFTDLVRRARAGEVTPPPGTAFEAVLEHRELDGEPLPDHIAGVELQNAIRPGIAVCRFAAFAALAMHEHPGWRERIFTETVERGSTTDGPLAVAFAEEVRRYYPFVPLLPAVARHDQEFEGEHLAEGDRVLIDIYGTNRDERHWSAPEAFDPERFLGTGEVFAEYFVPQGGGRPETGHRCPGEMITVGLLAQTVAELSRLDAEVARDGLDWSVHRLPTAPRNGVLLSRVRRRG